MVEKYGEDSSSYSLVDPELWFDSTGTNKKGRVHGTSHSLDIGVKGQTSLPNVTGSSFTKPVTQEDITTVVNPAMSSFVQTQLVPILS
jgi:hypothetical protein